MLRPSFLLTDITYVPMENFDPFLIIVSTILSFRFIQNIERKKITSQWSINFTVKTLAKILPFLFLL